MMGDLSSINSDNLFKFLATSGALMVLFSIIYPMDKQQKLELETIQVQKEVNVLTLKINQTTEKVLSDLKEINELINKYPNNNFLKVRKDSIQDVFDKNAEIHKIENEANEFEIKKIEILNRQIKDFTIWKYLLIIIGSILFILGMVFWVLKEINIWKSPSKNNESTI